MIGQGVPANRILVENKSTNTYENLRNSFDIIRKKEDVTLSDEDQVGVAYATTDYHVLRSGVISKELGVRATGLGSRTKWYFHMNEIIREFVAILNAEKRTHIRNIIFLLIYNIVLYLVSSKLGYL